MKLDITLVCVTIESPKTITFDEFDPVTYVPYPVIRPLNEPIYIYMSKAALERLRCISNLTITEQTSNIKGLDDAGRNN